MSFPKLKLTYFDIAGLAESIRLTFAVGGVPFVDERLTQSQFAEAKAAGKFKNGQVPVLEIDGHQLAQSNAILIYAGKLSGLYPWDPLAALKVEEILSTFDDIGAQFRPTYAEADLGKRAILVGQVFEGSAKPWFERLDAQLAKNGSGFIVGDSLSIADIRAYTFWTRRVNGLPFEYFSQFPHISAHAKKIGNHPLIAEYYAKRSSPKLKLTYFPGRGRAQAIRYTLFAGSIPFIDERLTGEQFQKVKSHIKHGQLPVLEVDGHQIAQSNAILIYAGKLAGLYPWDPIAALKVEEFLSTVDDIGALLIKLFYEPDHSKRAAIAAEIAEGPLKPWIERIDAQLAKNPSGFLVGDSLTIADLRAYTIYTDNVPGIPQSYFEAFPNLLAHKKKIAAIPKIAEYDTYRH